jgi:Zn finger protein HypA/HybF involved in hydrogenase expression
MPVLSHLHQFFCADTCRAYIHRLRWQDRPLHCPRCQSHDVGPWGNYHYRPGLKRYWCHGCRRTFSGSDTHVMLTLRCNSREVVVTDEQLDGTDMIGECLGERQRLTYQA